MDKCGICQSSWSRKDFIKHESSAAHLRKVEILRSHWPTLSVAERSQLHVNRAFCCPICEVNCPNLHSYDQHIIGQKHRAKVGKVSGEIPQTSIAPTPIPAPTPTPTPTTTETRIFNCGLCGFMYPNVEQLKAHLQGERHEKQLRIYQSKWPQMTKEDRTRYRANGIFNCSLCGTDLSALQGYIEHCRGQKHQTNFTTLAQNRQVANEKLPDIRDSPDRSSRQSNTPVEMPNIATANLKLPSSAGPIFCHLCLAYCLRPCDFSVHSYETKTWKKGSSPANPLIQPVIHPPESQNLRDLVCHCGVSSQIFISTKPELRPPVFLTNSTSAHGATTKFELLATGDRAAPIEPTSAPPETTSSLTSQTESASNRQYCEICDIYTMGEVVMESHLKGKQHKENLSGKAVTASSSPTANRTAIKSADLSNKSPAELYDRRRKLIGTIEPLKKSIRQMEKSEDELTAKIRHLADSIEANREMTEQLKISLVTQSARNEFNLHIERLTADHRNFCDKRAAVAADRDSTIQLLHEYTGEIQGINDALKSQLNGLFACKPCNMEFTSQLELQSHQQGKRHKEKLQKNAGRPIT